MLKNMDLLTSWVENKVARCLPASIALTFDGWSSVITHFIYVLAQFPLRNLDAFNRILLGVSSSEKKSRIDALSHRKCLEFVLSVFWKSLRNVMFFIENNCNRNKAAGNLFSEPLTGRHSYRFNVALQNILQKYTEIVNSVYELLAELWNLVTAINTQALTAYRPIVMDQTKWSSEYAMMRWYQFLSPFLSHINIQDVIVLLPSLG